MPEPSVTGPAIDWRAAVRRKAAETGVELPSATLDELAQHLEDLYAAAREAGEEAPDAHRKAVAALEHSTFDELQRHAARDERRLRRRHSDDLATPGGTSLHMSSALRMAVRRLRQQPSFALITMLVLGLGTAAAATITTIVDAVILRPLPYQRPDRLVTIWDTNAAQGLTHDPISPVNFMDQRALPVFDDAAAWWRPGVNLVDPGLDPVRVNTIEVSANIFEVLGVTPQLGAGFSAAGGRLFVMNEPAVVISDRIWRTRYGADPGIVGRQLQLNATPHTILGVMPAGFHYPDDVDVWQRLGWDLTQHSRQAHFMEAVGRLSDGTTLEQAQTAIDTLWVRLEKELEGTRNSPGRGWGSRLIPLLNEQLGYYRAALFVMFGAVGLLLVIGLLNIVSLLLTRSLAREKEIAIRLAMGASPRQLTAQLMAESLVLAAGGTVIGVAAAAIALPLIVGLTPVEIPRLEQATLSWPALALGLAITGVATIVFGVVPAILLLGGRVAADLKAGERGSSRGARRTYSVLVAGEVALACALLVSSALLVRTVSQMMDTPLGVQADDTLITTVQLTRPSASTGVPRDQWQTMASTHARIVEAVREQPGVEAAGASNFLPLEVGWRIPFALQGQPIPQNPLDLPQAQLHSVSEGYFEAMGARLSAGRMFTDFDGADSTPVLIVNETLARRYLKAGATIGQTILVGSRAVGPLGFSLMPPAPGLPAVPFQVVGVIDDVRNVPLGQAVEPALYVPLRQYPFSDVFVAVKADSTAVAVGAIRAALKSVAPRVPMGATQTWGDRFGQRTAEPRLLMAVLLAFGGLAAFLAALGVYGLFSWSVALRTRELAIRMALGARPTGVGGLVLRQSAALVVAGLIVGLVIIRFAEAGLATVLYQVSPSDLTSSAAAGGLLLMTALIACIPPVLRAMRVDPVDGLRAE